MAHWGLGMMWVRLKQRAPVAQEERPRVGKKGGAEWGPEEGGGVVLFELEEENPSLSTQVLL